jgi:hypothetical protein
MFSLITSSTCAQMEFAISNLFQYVNMAIYGCGENFDVSRTLSYFLAFLDRLLIWFSFSKISIGLGEEYSCLHKACFSVSAECCWEVTHDCTPVGIWVHGYRTECILPLFCWYHQWAIMLWNCLPEQSKYDLPLHCSEEKGKTCRLHPCAMWISFDLSPNPGVL